ACNLIDGMQMCGFKLVCFLTSCEAELQELMKQIDIMVAHKKSEWETQAQTLESCLDIREQELSSVRSLLDERHKEVQMLHQKLEDMEKAKQGMAVEYEQQLKRFQEELSRLKRSYEKLQKKHLKEAREVARCSGEDQSEVSRLAKKIEEFRQKSLDWEKQRLLYQQQVVSLEAQRKALAEQFELIQTQLTNRNQMMDSVELASQSEIQHLTRKLERATDTICASELEVERLNMRANDLTGVNQKILEEQKRVQEELRYCKKILEVKEEKMELRATLQSQEDFISSLKIQEEQVQKELTNLNEALHTKELIISLGSANARCIQLSEELTEKCQELKLMEDLLFQVRSELKKLKGQLSQAEQTHNSELEGMRKEIAQLTQELHQRDIAIASASGSTLDLEQRLRIEIEKAERKATENRAKDIPLTDLQESYIKTLHKLESEKQQLQKDLAETQDKLELSSRLFQDKYESALKQMQTQVIEIKNTECRKLQELHHKHKEEIRLLQTRLDKTVWHYEGAMQTLKAQHLSARMAPASSAACELTPQISRNNSMESLSSDSLLGADPLLSGFPTRFHFSGQKYYWIPLFSFQCPLPTSPIGSLAARFLEEEELRSQQILEQLDAHIEVLKMESERTVKQFTCQK
uniref:Centrosomal protein 63 n=1 Tax=Sphenodon punctatus TaxID=8508 RepID=A0A8D0HGP3_SPHPU